MQFYTVNIPHYTKLVQKCRVYCKNQGSYSILYIYGQNVFLEGNCKVLFEIKSILCLGMNLPIADLCPLKVNVANQKMENS